MATIRQSEFEAMSGWRATIKRRDSISFVIEGAGELKGKFYEYPDDWFSRYGVGPALESEVHTATLHAQVKEGTIVLLSGALP